MYPPNTDMSHRWPRFTWGCRDCLERRLLGQSPGRRGGTFRSLLSPKKPIVHRSMIHPPLADELPSQCSASSAPGERGRYWTKDRLIGSLNKPNGTRKRPEREGNAWPGETLTQPSATCLRRSHAMAMAPSMNRSPTAEVSGCGHCQARQRGVPSPPAWA